MIADRANDVQVVSTVTGTENRMSIDAEHMVHIMGVLTDLYADPEMAVIREYSTNGLDAQVEAGVVRPIEVTLPNLSDHHIRIRDFGIGLSADEIGSIYCKYGASTKRTSNEVVGMLGLGCKSALTYTDGFTVTSTKDGRTVVVLVQKDDQGGSMTVVSEYADDEREQGTEVAIPARTSNNFARKATTFFSFWPQDAVLLNGSAVPQFEGTKLTDHIYIVDGFNDQPQIVMGNVAYPLKGYDHPLHGLQLVSGKTVVCFVPIGDINFPPSREEVMKTDRTKATLQRLRDEFDAAAKVVVQDQINDAANHREAVKVLREWQRTFPGVQEKDFEYKGDKFEGYFKFTDHTNGHIHVPRENHTLSRHSVNVQLSLDQLVNAWFIIGYDSSAKFSAPRKRKLNAFAETRPSEENRYGQTVYGPSGGYVMLSDDSLLKDNPWINRDEQVFQWDDIKGIKLTPAQGGYVSGRPSGSFDMYVSSTSVTNGRQAADIDLSYPLAYYRGNRYEASQTAEAMSRIYPNGFTLVCMPGNREGKFCRDFPSAKRADALLQEAYNAWAKTVARADLVAMYVQDDYYLNRALKALDTTKVVDPALKEAKAAQTRDVKTLRVKRDAFQRIIHTLSTKADGWSNPFDLYPLVDGNAYSYSQHEYDYMNWVYSTKNP